MLSAWPKDGKLSVSCTPLHLCSCSLVLSGSSSTPWPAWFSNLMNVFKNFSLCRTWLLICFLEFAEVNTSPQLLEIYICRHFWHATHDCIVPYIDIILHRRQFWAKSAASGSVRWCCFRSCWTVLSHVMRGRPSCLLQSAGGEANRILLASALLSIRIICPNKVSRRDWIIAVSLAIHWLPISQRVVFRTALMVWKCVHGVSLSQRPLRTCYCHLRSSASAVCSDWHSTGSTRPDCNWTTKFRSQRTIRGKTSSGCELYATGWAYSWCNICFEELFSNLWV